MKQFRLLLAAATALAMLCASTSALAVSYPPTATETTVPTVHIKGSGPKLFFEEPKTVVAGEELKVVNETNPRKVGPHTFSLVTKGSLPKTAKARQLCFTSHHICKAIAAWHGVKGNGPPTINPAEAGATGWDTMGSLTKEGDSWFTGSKPGTSFEQPVTATPGRIYFLCAIHPWMHGSINVLPGG